MSKNVKFSMVGFFGLVLFLSGSAFAEHGLDKPQFQNQVLPFLDENCASCHENPGASFEKASKLVVPGNPDKSPLFRRAMGKDSHDPVVTEQELASLSNWIKGVAESRSTAQKGSDTSSKKHGPSLMGRVDFTMDYKNTTATTDSDLRFNSNHFFLFLKANVSPEVEFWGEFVGKYFYWMTYKPSSLVSLQLGKILVPFGDNSRFHLIYGGRRTGDMDAGNSAVAPNIWAEYGVNARWSLLNDLTVDTYIVSGISATAGSDPVFSTASDNSRQAVGIRTTYRPFSKFEIIGSVYFNEWREGKNIYMGGLDGSTEYGLVDAFLVRNFRLGLGSALAIIEGGTKGDYQKLGDYVELGTNLLPSGELRVRLGTYQDNHIQKSANDTQSFNVAWIVPVSSLKFMLEHQLNFEAVNEVSNDLTRLMVVLTF